MNLNNWANKINDNNEVYKLVIILKNKSPKHKLYVHRNGTPGFIKNF